MRCCSTISNKGYSNHFGHYYKVFTLRGTTTGAALRTIVWSTISIWMWKKHPKISPTIVETSVASSYRSSFIIEMMLQGLETSCICALHITTGTHFTNIKVAHVAPITTSVHIRTRTKVANKSRTVRRTSTSSRNLGKVVWVKACIIRCSGAASFNSSAWNPNTNRSTLGWAGSWCLLSAYIFHQVIYVYLVWHLHKNVSTNKFPCPAHRTCPRNLMLMETTPY